MRNRDEFMQELLDSLEDDDFEFKYDVINEREFFRQMCNTMRCFFKPQGDNAGQPQAE